MNIEELIQKYGIYIYNYALKLTCHPVDAEDIAQETFINAWKNLDGLKDENAVKKWLITICYHQFLMKIRSRSHKKEDLLGDLELLEQEGIIFNDYFPNPEEEVIVDEEIKSLQNGCFLAMVRKLTTIRKSEAKIKMINCDFTRN